MNVKFTAYSDENVGFPVEPYINVYYRVRT